MRSWEVKLSRDECDQIERWLMCYSECSNITCTKCHTIANTLSGPDGPCPCGIVGIPKIVEIVLSVLEFNGHELRHSDPRMYPRLDEI